MKKIQKRIIIIAIFVFIISININTQIYAASMKLSISKTSAYVGESFTATISGINGKVSISANSNISINQSGTQWVDGSLTISGTTKAVGTGKITVKPIDATTTAAEPDEVTQSSSCSITIKQKEEIKPQTKPQTTPTTTKKETKKDDNKTVEDNFYILSLVLQGVKENGEKSNIKLSPEFSKNVYEYSCNIESDIQSLEIQKDAGEYTNSIIVTGTEELKEGENIVKLQLSAENYETKMYTIKVIKAQKETVETVSEIVENDNEQKINENKQTNSNVITMPLGAFIALQAGIIVIEIFLILIFFKKKILGKKRLI